jgi:hypothetical protein
MSDLAAGIVDAVAGGLAFARELVALERERNTWKARYQRAAAAAKDARARLAADRIARAAKDEIKRRKGKS